MKIATSIFLAALLTLPTAQARPEAQREQFYSALSGSWTGQLEYRDFQSNEHTVLPAWLDVKPSADGHSLEFTYTYDDGPTKTVTETSTVTIDPTKREYTTGSSHDHADTYRIDDLTPGKRGDNWQLKLSGTGRENDHPVDVRITITIDRNLYRLKKETRQPGQEFQFRDAYTFTRRMPPHP